MKEPLPKVDLVLKSCPQTTSTGPSGKQVVSGNEPSARSLINLCSGKQLSSGKVVSRRKFLLSAGLGTAGAALLLSRPSDIFAGTFGPSTEAADSEVGEVTLDGLMMTYFSMPPAFASSIFTFGKNFSTSFTLKVPQAPGIVLTGTIEPGSPAPAGIHSQHTSSWVKDGLVLRSASETQANSRKEKFSGQESSDPLQIYGLRSPKLRFSGSTDRLQFSFSDMGQRSFNLGREVSRETSASMYSQYITDPAQLFPPRFYWLDVNGGDGKTAFDFVLPSKLMVRNGITATVTVKIVDQTGFRSRVLRDAFAPGNDVEITYHSAQEFYSKNLMELQTTPLARDTRIYIDRVFKTFVMN